jgi:hypothetical protein
MSKPIFGSLVGNKITDKNTVFGIVKEVLEITKDNETLVLLLDYFMLRVCFCVSVMVVTRFMLFQMILLYLSKNLVLSVSVLFHLALLVTLTIQQTLVMRK